MKTRHIEGQDELVLSLPSGQAALTGDAIRKFLELSGHTVETEEEDDGRSFSVQALFPDASPGFALKGLRVKEDLTQAELAMRLGLKQHHVSDMEKGKRPISAKLAKRIEEEFGVTYKAFL
jgi:DNA-binding XRE family transcriptional regulator